MQTPATLVEEARAFLEQLATTRGRLAVSGLVVATALVVAALVVPYTVGRLRAAVRDRLLSGRVGRSVDVVGDYLPTTLSELLVRLAQFGVVVGMALSLLVVWGMADVAVALLLGAVGAVPYLFSLLGTAALVLLGLVATDQLRRVIAGFSKGADRVTEHQEEILLRVGQVTLFVTVTAMILGLWGVDLDGLLVGAGFLGIVVGFAARQTLGSLIAGFVLMFSRPFTIGDWVQVGDQEGVVTDITIFNTRLENFDGEFVVIPNDRVSDRAVTNRSQKGLLRLRTDVGVDYETDIEHARETAADALADVDAVTDTPAPQVVPKSFGDSAVVLEMRYWIDHPTPPRKWNAVAAVIERVKSEFDEAGVTIPYPQRELSARDGRDVDAGGRRPLATGPVDGDGRPAGDAGNGHGTPANRGNPATDAPSRDNGE